MLTVKAVSATTDPYHDFQMPGQERSDVSSTVWSSYPVAETHLPPLWHHLSFSRHLLKYATPSLSISYKPASLI